MKWILITASVLLASGCCCTNTYQAVCEAPKKKVSSCAPKVCKTKAVGPKTKLRARGVTGD